MKPAALPSLLLVLLGTTAHAQLSLLPQVGFEHTRTTLAVNNSGSFAPLGSELAPRAALRLDYRFKGGHGPYASLGTAAPAVHIRFADAQSAPGAWQAEAGSLRPRLEGGYHYSTQPLFFKKAAPATTMRSVTVRKTCGSYTYTYHKTCAAKAPDQRLNLRLQPSVGAAFVPAAKDNLAPRADGYLYRAGNWNSALVVGSGFELGRGTQRLLTLSVHYLKGLGNLQRHTLTTEYEGKTTQSAWKSDASGWSLTVGVPFTLAQKKTAAPQPRSEIRIEHKKKTEPQSTPYRSRCGQYRSQLQ